jgi:TrwC relaxase/AAA domain
VLGGSPAGNAGGDATGTTWAVTGNLIAATFPHDASRSLDMQLHKHHVTAAATWDTFKNRWIALDEIEMVKAIRYAGKVYQNEIARACLKLGYDIELIRDPKRGITGFEIKGVSEELRERFAKRRAEVEKGIAEFIAKHGYEPTAVEISAITKATRSAKLAEISTPEVRQMQLAQLSGDEIRSLEKIKQTALERSAAMDIQLVIGQEGPYLHRSVEHLYERNSVQKGREILAEALNLGLGRVDLNALHKKMANSPRLLVGLSDSYANPVLSAEYATPKGLALEKWAVATVNAGQQTMPVLGRDGFEISRSLNVEQHTAVKTILFNNRDQVMALRGVAGAGKTTTLTELHRGLQDAGHRVFYALTSYKAQGRTADYVIVAAGQMDSKTCYVACSRGRESCTVHTPSTENLLNRLPPQKTGDRKAALEVLPQTLPVAEMVRAGAADAVMKSSLADLVIGSRATVWEALIPKPISAAINRAAQLAMPGLGQIQGLISLAKITHEWGRRLTVEKEMERERL